MHISPYLWRGKKVRRHGPILCRYGFTLLETVVALAVILAAVVGPVSLITRGLFAFSFSKNKVIATNLAQEGIELVRLIRDNNVACDSLNGPPPWNWNNDPETGVPIGRATVGLDVNNFRAIRDAGAGNPCGIATIMSPVLSVSCSGKLLFESDPVSPNYGLYTYRSGFETVFSRCVSIISPPDAPDGDIPGSSQMDVIATVTWNERGSDKNVVLRERMYDWR